MKAVEHRHAPAETAPPIEVELPTARPRGGLRLRAKAILLLASALVFCLFVAHQRDKQMRQLTLDKAEHVRVWLQDYVDDRGYLPPSLPPEVSFGKTARLPYPSVELVRSLRTKQGPQILTVSPRCGLIRPGGDGCAAIIYDGGRVSTRWMSMSEVREAIRQRQVLRQDL